MFTYFFSLVIIIFEAICCNLFYDVFCKENSRLRKSQKVLLMLSLICCYYLCGLLLYRSVASSETPAGRERSAGIEIKMLCEDRSFAEHFIYWLGFRLFISLP